jgi:hypothetical protein
MYGSGQPYTHAVAMFPEAAAVVLTADLQTSQLNQQNTPTEPAKHLN